MIKVSYLYGHCLMLLPDPHSQIQPEFVSMGVHVPVQFISPSAAKDPGPIKPHLSVIPWTVSPELSICVTLGIWLRFDSSCSNVSSEQKGRI